MKIVSALKWAVKGDAIASNYRQGEQIGEYGEKKLWKIYNGTRNSTGEKVAIFILYKSILKRYVKENRDYYLSLMAKSINLLNSSQHYSVIKLVTPFTETKENYAFVTEPLIGTLESLITDNKLNKVVNEEKMKYGIMSLADGISHFHQTNTLLQCLTPTEIFITQSGRWKIGSALYASNSTNPISTCYKYNKECLPIMDISYGYVALENLTETGTVSTFGDIFTLGSLIVTVFNYYYPSGAQKNPLKTTNLKNFESELGQFKYSSHYCLNIIPDSIRTIVQSFLDPEPSSRSQLCQFLKNCFFNDINISTMKSVDVMDIMSRDERKKFMMMLLNIITNLTNDTIITFITPMTLKYMIDVEYTFLCLKLMTISIDICTLTPFEGENFTRLNFLCDSRDHEVIAHIIEKFDLLTKLSGTHFERSYSVLISRALESNNINCRGLALDSVRKKLGSNANNFITSFVEIIPSVGSLLSNNDCPINIHINAFMCLADAIPYMDFDKIDQKIFPILLNVTNAAVAYLMAYLGLIQTIFKHVSKKMDSDMILTKLAPIMLRMSMHPDFNQEQVKKFKKTIYILLDSSYAELINIRQAGPPPSARPNMAECQANFSKPHTNSIPNHQPINYSSAQFNVSNTSNINMQNEPTVATTNKPSYTNSNTSPFGVGQDIFSSNGSSQRNSMNTDKYIPNYSSQQPSKNPVNYQDTQHSNINNFNPFELNFSQQSTQPNRPLRPMGMPQTTSPMNSNPFEVPTKNPYTFANQDDASKFPF